MAKATTDGPRGRRLSRALVVFLVAATAAVSPMPGAAAAGTVFADGFESGSLSAWSVRTSGSGTATVQTTRVRTGSYAVRLSSVASGNSYAYARGSLGGSGTEIVASASLYIEGEGAAGANVPLLRLFDAGGARLVSVYRQNGTANRVWVQHSGTYSVTTGTLGLGRWTRVDVRAVTAGAGGSTLEVTLDGALVYRTTTASLGTAGVATVQIGNETQDTAFLLYADDVSVTQPDTGTDTTPPDTTILTGPAGTVALTTASFTFSATEIGSTFECRLDAAAWAACAMPISYSGLAQGSHSFSVRATDPAGNTDQTPASRTWTVSPTTGCPTPTSPSTSDPGTVVVADGFEGGTLCQWTESTEQGDASVRIQTDDVYSGQAALRLHVTTKIWSSRANLIRSLPAGATEVWADGRFKVEREGADTGWNTPTFRLFSNGKRIFDVSRQNGDGNFFVRFPNGSGGWTIPSTGRRLSVGRWYNVKIHVVTTPGLGTAEVWLDGSKVYFNSAVTFGTDRIEAAMVGAEHQNQDGDVTADNVVIKAVVPPPSSGVFVDGFESGNFLAWTAATTAGGGTATVQTQLVKTGANAARLTATATTGSFSNLRKTLNDAQPDLTVKAAVRVEAEGAAGGTAPLLDLFGPDGARLVNVQRLNQSGNKVSVQHGGVTYPTTGTLALGTWADVQVHTVANGPGAGAVEVSLNGTTIYTTAAASLGYDGVKTIQVGANTTGKGYTVVVDDVVATKGKRGPVDDPRYKLLIADYLNKRLLITDFDGNVVWRFDNPTGKSDYAAGPIGVRWLPNNQILASFGSGDVGVIDVATKRWVWKTTGYNGEAFQSPYDAELLPDGRLAVALRFNNGGRVSVYDRSTGQEVWRHYLSNAHSVHFRSADQSYNSSEPTLLVGGWGAIREVTYRPGASTQAVTWQVTSEYTHDAIVIDNDQLLTTEGYYVQKINRSGTKLWKRYTPEENRRMAVNPNVGGGYVYTVGEGDRIEFRDANGYQVRDWNRLSDGTQLDYPYGIQVINYLPAS
jgi:hypothetical protein